MKDKEDVHVPGMEYAGNGILEVETWNPGKEAGMQGRRCMQWCTAISLQVGTPAFAYYLL